jgi:hypothetical protein
MQQAAFTRLKSGQAMQAPAKNVPPEPAFSPRVSPHHRQHTAPIAGAKAG